MSAKETFIYLVIAAAVAAITTGFISHQLNIYTLFIFCSIAVPTLISYYFSSRKTAEPSKIEKISALIWLFIRRLVCFVAAIMFAATALKLMFFSEVLFYQFWTSLALILAAIFCIWVGIYGRKLKGGTLQSDVAFHAQNKARYKWPW